MSVIMKKFIKNTIAILISALLPINTVWAYSPVPCGNYVDGYRCHFASNVGTPPPRYHTLGDKVMNYGVGAYGSNTRYYWIDPYLPANYTSPIQDAFYEWVYTTNSVGVTTSISIHETSIKSAAYFEVVLNDGELPYGTMASTRHYIGSNRVDINNKVLDSNYGWAKIIINVTYMAEQGYDTATGIKQTVAHEIGHGMGLSHQNCNSASIMCQTAYGLTATRANAFDLQTINHLYG